MAHAERTKPLNSLLTAIARKHKNGVSVGISDSADQSGSAATDIFHGDAVLREFVRAALVWESTTIKAEAALKRIASSVVDINEFRVSLPDEMASIIGASYPRLEERVAALRACLGEIFKREQRLRLAHLASASKKAASGYLGSLPMVPPYVSDRVAMLCCQCHALPVDSRIGAVLVSGKVVAQSASAEQSVTNLLRQIKPGDAIHAFSLLQAAADALPLTSQRPAAARRTAKIARSAKSDRAARAGTKSSRAAARRPK